MVSGNSRDQRQKCYRFCASEFLNMANDDELIPTDKPVGKEIEKTWYNYT